MQISLETANLVKCNQTEVGTNPNALEANLLLAIVSQEKSKKFLNFFGSHKIYYLKFWKSSPTVSWKRFL